MGLGYHFWGVPGNSLDVVSACFSPMLGFVKYVQWLFSKKTTWFSLSFNIFRRRNGLSNGVSRTHLWSETYFTFLPYNILLFAESVNGCKGQPLKHYRLVNFNYETRPPRCNKPPGCCSLGWRIPLGGSFRKWLIIMVIVFAPDP